MSNSNLIYKKMIDAMRDIGAIGKDRTNPAQGYKYRGIDEFLNACHPVFAKHGIFLTTQIKSIVREERATRSGGINTYTNMQVLFNFHAEDGSTISTELPGEAMDTGDKSTNKALSAALKYCLAQMLLIPLDMHDSEAASPEKVEMKIKPNVVTQASEQIISSMPNMGFIPEEDTNGLRLEYLNLLNKHKTYFTPDQIKTMQPGKNWDNDKYARGIDYIKLHVSNINKQTP